MDREYFDKHIDDFSKYLLSLNSDCDIPKDEKIKDRYYNQFKHCENKRFSKVLVWLYRNWPTKYKSFPGISEFRNAFNETSEGRPEPKPQPRESINETLQSKAFKRVYEGIEMLDRLEMEVTKKKMGKNFHTGVSRMTRLSYWVPFIRQVLRANMLYHIKRKQWIKRSEVTEITEEWFNPREFYPLEYYK